MNWMNWMNWMKWIGTLTVLLAVGFLALAAYGNARWNRLTQDLHARLEAARTPPQPGRYDARELEELPAPVQRYFRAVLIEGQPVVAAATLEHTGRFNMGETTDQWKPFTSRQWVVTRQPGFVWDGRISMLPGLAVHVHDAYIAGEGLLQPAILGLFTLVDIHGTGDLAQGELMRFLAEAVWYPTSLLPGQGIRWEAVDAHSARATLVDRGHAVTLTFRFGDDGLIEAVRAEARGRMVAGRAVPTPWEGSFSNYQNRNGMRVPVSGEVAWLLPEGRKPYWRGTITSLTCQFAK